MKVSKINFLLIIVLSSITIIVSKIGNNLLNIEELYYQSLSANLSSQQIERIFEIQKKIQWLIYIIAPIVTMIKTMLITSVTYIGIVNVNIATKRPNDKRKYAEIRTFKLFLFRLKN